MTAGIDFAGVCGIRDGSRVWEEPLSAGILGSYEMSMHSSLKSGSKIAVKRNVLKRYERVDILRKKGKWKDGDRAYGLPKTKSA